MLFESAGLSSYFGLRGIPVRRSDHEVVRKSMYAAGAGDQVEEIGRFITSHQR